MCVRIGVIDGDGVKINYTAIPSLHDLRRAALSFSPPKAFPPRGILPAECRQSSTTRSLHFAKIIDEASSERSQLGPVLGSSHDLFCTSY